MSNLSVFFVYAEILHNKSVFSYSTYVRLLRGTARIHPPQAVAAATDRYLLPTVPTAANLQQRVCCCRTMQGQTDGEMGGQDTVPFHRR